MYKNSMTARFIQHLCSNTNRRIHFLCQLCLVALLITAISLLRYAETEHKQLLHVLVSNIRTASNNILIVGGLGTLGRSLSVALCKGGHNVIVLDVNDDSREFLEELKYQNIDPKRVKIFHGDIRSYSAIHAIRKEYRNLSGIVHLAGVSREDWCLENLDDCSSINIEATRMFLEAASSLFSQGRQKPWLLYLSSYLVYGDHIEPGVINEDS